MLDIHNRAKQSVNSTTFSFQINATIIAKCKFLKI